MTNHLRTAIATFIMATAMTPAMVLAQSTYPVNFDEDEASSHLLRHTNAVQLTSSYGTQTVQVNQKKEKRMYIKRLDDCLRAKIGETVTAGFDWSGTWMCGYAYIDFGKDGNYDVDYDDNGVNAMKDLMTYSMYKNKDSKGATVSGEPSINPPSFTIPSDVKPGIYRMRYKVDWDCVDPGGNMLSGNDIKKNGGVIVDTRINVHGETAHVTVKGADEKKGTLSLADYSAELNNQDVEFGKDLTIAVCMKDGYYFSSLSIKHGYCLDGEAVVDGLRQWQENIIMAYTAKGDKLTIPASYIDGDVEITVNFAAESATSGSSYALNFEKDLAQMNPTANSLTEFSITNKAGKKSAIAIPEGTTVYRDALTKEVNAKPGDVLTPGITFTGNTDLGAYLYIDYNQDAVFTTPLDETGKPVVGSELVSFSAYNGKNSNGEAAGATTAMPSFTIPDDLPTGVYRARLKIDKNNIDPAGDYSMSDALHIDNYNGYIVDFLLNIHNDKGSLDIDARGGHIVGNGNSGVSETVEFGSQLSLMPIAPAAGYNVKSIAVRHGHNLDGEQFVNGNRQWDEYEVSDAKAGEGFTIDADKVNGDVRVSAKFEADGTEEYKLRFADEFDGKDYSLPDAGVWHNCTRESPTWKRFTSQTAEGQQKTAFIRDGKLVTRCIKNTIAEEGDVEMISGAIESSDKMYFTYGRVEGRLRTTPHVGNFPAFWLMPQDNSAGWPNAGEIDIWEQIDTENKTYHTVHTHCTHDLHLALPNSGSTHTNAADYHVITLDWTPTLLTWYVDGTKAFSYAKTKQSFLLERGQWPYDKPFYLILNQSVGNGSWAKNCDVNFEYETLFDYVRLYQKDGEGDITSAVKDVKTSGSALDVYAQQGGLLLVAPEAQKVDVYSISGTRIFSGLVQGNRFVSLTKGVYVVAGKKIVVK